MSAASPSAPTPGTVLVTGAATGIGLATAWALAMDGWRVLGTALPGQNISALTDVPGAIVIEADLTDEASLARLIHLVHGEPELTALVSNAGLAVAGPVEGIPADQLRTQFELNTIAPILLAQALLPQLRATRGRMVFLGAGQGRVALPFGGPYGASKAALASLTDALRMEIADTGVTVSLIEPGAVRTGILDDSRRRALALLDRLPPEVADRYRAALSATFARSERAFSTAMSPEQVAELIGRILAAPTPKPRHLVGREAVGLAVLATLPARWRTALVERVSRVPASTQASDPAWRRRDDQRASRVED
ncbi:MAG: SDR family NAD(P)-dependent oxidoreductase [Cryobacterium sp.]